MKKHITIAVLISLIGSTAMADRVNIASGSDVARSVERLATAVEAAGARVLNKIDFTLGNASVGKELRPTTIVIFGSPKIGAQALQDRQTMALNLPLRIMNFEDAYGQTWATYDDPATNAPTPGLAPNHPAVLAMKGALEVFSAAATGQ